MFQSDQALPEIRRGGIAQDQPVLRAGEQIGGDYIDKELAQRIHAKLNLKLENKDEAVAFEEMAPEQKDKLINACEKAKIQISEDGGNYLLTIRNYGIYGTKTLKISVEEFEDILKPIIEKYVVTTIRKVLYRAELSPGSIDAVVAAGGSSSLRMFGLVLENIFGAEKVIRPQDFQFVSAEGAAVTNLIGGDFRLNDDVGILLSDNTVFPILQKEKDGVNSEKQYTFSLVEDAPDAHFIFTNGNGKNVFDKINVPTKGFLKEHLVVTAQIGFDQIARIKIHSDAMPKSYLQKLEISGLTYYYELAK